MRRITLIIIHCSATPEGRSLDFETCRNDHIRHRGFRDIGYHFYITRDGTIHPGRPLEQVGAHCRNHNRHSIGICYEGGLSGNGRPADTRTLPQKGAMLALLRELKRLFPKARPFMPSAIGMGIVLTLPAAFSNASSFAIGAIFIWAWNKLHKKSEEEYSVALASGLVGGESIACALAAMTATAVLMFG